MQIYLVTLRRGKQAAPVYKIAAESAMAAKKTACRLDGQDEKNYWQYMAAVQKSRRTAATVRRVAEPKDSAIMKTDNNIAYALKKSKRGRRP